MTEKPATRAATALALIGFGEAGQAFAGGWLGEAPRAIAAYDIKTGDPAAREAKLADYARIGVTGTETPEDALAGAPLVFSLVTADQARVAAEAAAPHLAEGALFFDCNSCAPNTKRGSAEIVEAAGGRYVDAAVMSPVHPKLHRTPILLSGPHAAEAKATAEALGMAVRVVEGEVGAASSIKMIRSVMIKGLEALTVECVLSAVRAGVDEEVLASLDATFPAFDWRARAAYMLERAATHGVRRAAEMREVAATVDDLGLNGQMSRSTAARQDEIGRLGVIAREDENYKDLAERLLAALPAEGSKP